MALQIEKRTQTVDVAGTAVTVSPLALGFSRRIKQRGVVCPPPPQTVARDSSGRVLRDDQGQPVLVAEPDGAEYQAAVERYHERVAVLMLAESIVEQGVFEACRPAEQTGWCAYADAIADELVESGWTSGDLVRVCQAICEVSRLTQSDVSKAGVGFFSPAAKASPD